MDCEMNDPVCACETPLPGVDEGYVSHTCVNCGAMIDADWETLNKLTDQWNGVFYADDSQVVELIARKVFAAERPGVEIIVEPLGLEAP